MKKLLLAASALLFVPFGCDDGDESAPVDTACAEGNTIGAVCAGVPATPTGDTASCNAVLTVATASELDSALSGTSGGDCVVLAAGKYAAVTLPAGVSLIGAGADATTVDAVTVTSGTSGVADLTIESGTLTVRSGAVATLSGTRILDSGGDAVLIEEGASATIRQSEITAPARYGISAFDVASVNIEQTIIEDAEGPGMWLSCAGGCECTSTVSGTIKDTVFRNNRIVGLSFVGASVTLDNVRVADTTVGDNFEAGGGISASGCSDVDATALTVENNVDFGMLVDDSSLSLDGGTIDDNLRGLWVQAIGATRPTDGVSVLNTVLSANEGVGFGVDKASVNVSIASSRILDTKIVPLPVLVNGVSASAMDVGDGMAWLGTSEVTVTNVSLENNARAGLLIDGPVASGSLIEDLALSGTSGTLDLLQQNLPPGGQQPTTSGTTPAIESDSAERFAIPSEIVIPPSI